MGTDQLRIQKPPRKSILSARYTIYLVRIPLTYVRTGRTGNKTLPGTPSQWGTARDGRRKHDARDITQPVAPTDWTATRGGAWPPGRAPRANRARGWGTSLHLAARVPSLFHVDEAHVAPQSNRHRNRSYTLVPHGFHVFRSPFLLISFSHFSNTAASALFSAAVCGRGCVSEKRRCLWCQSERDPNPPPPTYGQTRREPQIELTFLRSGINPNQFIWNFTR